MKTARKTRRWRKPPYYKIQLLNPVVQSWMDEQKAYDSLEEARRHADEKFEGKQFRIVHVEETGRNVVHVVEPNAAHQQDS
jgi:hypothetical protein